ncbi:MAG: hypothetical protein HWE30_15715 [Methylocystaceae bacterium]|nr:hypothetical protein [Methylocystaceae bacterium]
MTYTVSDGEEKTPLGRPYQEQERRMTANTDEPMSPYDAYEEFDFDPRGDGQKMFGVKNPIDGGRAYLDANTANEVTSKLFKGVKPHNNEADAFRHAYWSYLMTQNIGADKAKHAGNSHEITEENTEGERLMDLYNNRIGRQLALDPKNKGRPAEEVIREAIKDGKLRTSPFKILGERDYVPSPFGN